jgi:Zn-dependent alcohol dehydrogenase
VQAGAGTVMNILKPEPDSSIAIFGLGTVGLTALMGAKYLGVKQIIAVDIQEKKFPLAEELGATDIVNSKGIDLEAKLKELTGGVGVDYAVDCTGVPAVIEAMLRSLGMRGTAATVGVPPTGAKVQIDPLQYLLGSRRYLGCREGDSVPDEFIPKLVEMQRAGHFPVEKLTKVYNYKDFGQALKDLHDGTVVKPVIQWY